MFRSCVVLIYEFWRVVEVEYRSRSRWRGESIRGFVGWGG